MKVILLADVRDQGKKGEMKDVSDGYARNYLLPRKLAMEANADNMNALRLKEKAAAAKAAAEREKAVENAKQLESIVLRIKAKAGSNGKLFGAITSKEISEGLAAQENITVDKKSIVLSDPIKAYGSYEVKCKFGYEVSGVIHVMVTEA